MCKNYIDLLMKYKSPVNQSQWGFFHSQILPSFLFISTWQLDLTLFVFVFKLINLFILLYNIVLVLPYIVLILPLVYIYSPSWSPLPPHPIPLGHPSVPAPSILYHASKLDWRLVSHMIIYMFQWHSPISTTFQKHQFLNSQLSLWFNSHICTWLLERPYL